MFDRLASLALRPRRVLAVAAAWIVVAAVVGGPLPKLLTPGPDLLDPGSESNQAAQRISDATGGEADPLVLALVRPARPARVTEVKDQLRKQPWAFSVSTIAAKDPEAGTIVAVRTRHGVDQHAVATDALDEFDGVRDVSLGGRWIFAEQVTEQAAKDFTRATLIAFPLVALLALLAFRGGLVALLPLAGGAITILTAFVVLRGIDQLYSLAPASMNMVIALALGLSVDYSLFLVTRYREELANRAPADALRTTLATTGRTVVFSAICVAAPLAALTVFPLRLLRSMGIEGALLPLIAAASALLVVPALIVAFGKRVRPLPPMPDDRWRRWARAVIRRPAATAVVTIAALLIIGAPALRAQFVASDAGSLSTDQSARVVSDTLEQSFDVNAATPIIVALDAPAGSDQALRTYAAQLAREAGVSIVAPPRQVADGLWVIQTAAPGRATDIAARRAIDRVRDVAAPFPVRVGGDGAAYRDQLTAMERALPLAGALLAITTLLTLWLMTGSVLLPVKTLLMSALTVISALGLLVLVFQDDRLRSILGAATTGGVDAAVFITVAAIAFGLSTDYAVFLLSSIREARRGDDRDAIATGLARVGRLVTAAALMLAVSLGTLVISQILLVKQFGLGAALAVLIDAFVIRALLVPALMVLMGRWNWWAPQPLRRAHRAVQ